MSTAKNGDHVLVNYRGTLTDGTEFDSSYGRGQPLPVEVGDSKLISGFRDAIVGMSIGEKKIVVLGPEQAYGEVNPAAVTHIDRSAFPEGLELSIGMPIPLANPEGAQAIGRITQLNEQAVTVDLNHPLAGQILTFEIELVEITEEST
jgi:peptidylprolyl isomerase